MMGWHAGAAYAAAAATTSDSILLAPSISSS